MASDRQTVTTQTKFMVDVKMALLPFKISETGMLGKKNTAKPLPTTFVR